MELHYISQLWVMARINNFLSLNPWCLIEFWVKVEMSLYKIQVASESVSYLKPTLQPAL